MDAPWAWFTAFAYLHDPYEASRHKVIGMATPWAWRFGVMLHTIYILLRLVLFFHEWPTPLF